MKDEKTLVEELRRYPPSAPSPELETRIFAAGENGIIKDLLRLAALLLIYLGMILALFPAQPDLPGEAVERDSLSSFSGSMHIKEVSAHD